MLSYSSATVKNFVEDEILLYNFEVEDDNEITKYVFEQMNKANNLTIVRQDIPNTSMKIQECWDMLASKFADYSLVGILRVVDIHIIDFLHNQIKELKKAK